MLRLHGGNNADFLEMMLSLKRRPAANLNPSASISSMAFPVVLRVFYISVYIDIKILFYLGGFGMTLTKSKAVP